MIFVNDIRQDWRHADFVSMSNSGLGYAPIQGSAGDTLAVIFDSKEEDRAFLETHHQHEKYIREHWVKLELNGRGLI